MREGVTLELLLVSSLSLGADASGMESELLEGGEGASSSCEPKQPIAWSVGI